MITTKTKSTTGDLMPSSSMSTITSSVHSIKSNAATRRQHIRNGGSGGNSLRSRPIKHHHHPRPPLKPIHKTSNNNNLKREYKIRESQTLLLLITTTISFLLFLLFTLPFYALVGLTMMTTFLGLGIVVATSALKTRYLLELEHPLGLLRYLPQKVRVPLTEKSLHDCLISPSTSLNSLKSLDRVSGGGGSGNDSNNSSKNSLSSMLNNKGNNGSNHSSMESLASYNNSSKKNSSSLSSLSYPRRSSSRPSLLPPPPPPPPDRDEDDDDIKPNHTNEFACSGFDVMRQATVKMGNKTVANQSISQQHQDEKEIGDNDKRKREEGGIKSDRYSIYQTNQQVIR
mmetsp:Transcript_13969/g.28483  ORF Transcript_13969/g.28483 Transcript_13969/m.28483 type:complete len:342 (+) Transcript_13969:149-1174(+)